MTKLAYFLRSLRLEKGEILKDMATKLEVSSAFLSAVENGKKKMPIRLIEKLSMQYQLSAKEEAELSDAVLLSNNSVEINLENLSTPKKQLVLALAREIESFDNETIEQLNQICKEAK